eukprot:5691050-Pyramimonas_sp.AAC.1
MSIAHHMPSRTPPPKPPREALFWKAGPPRLTLQLLRPTLPARRRSPQPLRLALQGRARSTGVPARLPASRPLLP